MRRERKRYLIAPMIIFQKIFSRTQATLEVSLILFYPNQQKENKNKTLNCTMSEHHAFDFYLENNKNFKTVL